MSTGVEHVAAEIDAELGGPTPLRFPEDWTLSSSWQRAQDERAHVGPTGPARFSVILGTGARHRVTFTLKGGELLSDCDCKAHQYREWCAHVAVLWWKWCRSQLAVTDLDTGRTHLSPPWWLSVDG
jgi:hypothetical protein